MDIAVGEPPPAEPHLRGTLFAELLLRGEFQREVAPPGGSGFGTPRRVNLQKGDVWIQDPRAIHRGTPNSSDAPRPEIVRAE